MKEIASVKHPVEAGDGGGQNYDNVQIKLFGFRDEANRQLRERVEAALAVYPVPHEIIAVSEPNAIAAAGVTATPALQIDGYLATAGQMSSVDAVVSLLRDRHLRLSKLYRLRRIAVAVDISAAADNALRYAWQLAQQVGADLEVAYAIDSIFDGHTPSPSGFLSSYQKTMQQELDAFVQESMAKIGVRYEPGPYPPGAPGQPRSKDPVLLTKVVYGFPDAALEEYSRHVDLLILGATGRGVLRRRLFGSVSVEVSKNAHCPALFVPPGAEFRGLQNLLYAGNFESLHALSVRQALAFAQRFEGLVHFVHVGPVAEPSLEPERQLFEEIYRSTHPDQPFVFSKMVGDDVIEALYSYAFEHRIGMLVFVTHQRNFWEAFLHKSITREALLDAGLPVLVIHSDENSDK